MTEKCRKLLGRVALKPIFHGSLAAFFLAAGAVSAAEPPRFGLPVDCAMGTDCVVQNYVDTDPGPAAKDYTCGPLTYDGHAGTDIRLPSLVEMRRGVAVLAAASGIVKARRDGMADISTQETGATAIKGREAGNGVVLDHGNGWETQYSHLRKGSIRVRRGQRVTAGETLGQIGLSGRTEFPHLHFTVRHNGKRLDPFTGLALGAGCGKSAGSLWTEAAQKQLAYRAGGLLVAGFADEVPTIDTLIEGAHRADRLDPDSPALVFWAVSWGLRNGDRETIRLTGPDGRVMTEKTSSIPKDKARWMRFTGKKLKRTAWPAGRYRGDYRVERIENGIAKTVIDVTRTIEVR